MVWHVIWHILIALENTDQGNIPVFTGCCFFMSRVLVISLNSFNQFGVTLASMGSESDLENKTNDTYIQVAKAQFFLTYLS